MRAHVIENGAVVNTIEVDTLDALPNLIPADHGSIGWLWDGEALTDPNAPTEAQLIEAQWVVVRADRNGRLSACDWTQLPDSPLSASERGQWTAYRQELRDITLQADPFSILWPVAP